MATQSDAATAESAKAEETPSEPVPQEEAAPQAPQGEAATAPADEPGQNTANSGPQSAPEGDGRGVGGRIDRTA